MEYKDYYKILGVERKANADTIKKAYRKMARKYHPDVSKEANAEERFKEVNEAYEVLSDPEKRSAYDELGSNWQAKQQFREAYGANEHAMHGAQFSDFFNEMFGRTNPFQGAGRAHRQSVKKGEDLHADINVSLEDVMHGSSCEIQVPIHSHDAFGRIVTTHKTLKVKIPQGVKQGQQIRIAGQGEPGQGHNAPKGDIYLKVNIIPHARYSVQNKDLSMILPLTPWEAALGTSVSIPTLTKKIDIKIPPNSQTGKKLRVKGLGLPGNPPGDLFIVLNIINPNVATDEEKKIFKQMAELMPFDPRA